MKNRILLASLLSITLAVSAAPQIPESMRGRTISVVVPYGPGGNSDIVARQLAQQVTVRTGMKTVVINKPGASGSIAASFVAGSAPDGLTVCQCETGPAFFNRIIGLAGSPDKDSLVPVSASIEGVLGLAVSGTSPIQDMRGLVEYLKSNSKTAAFASTGSIALAWSEEFLDSAHVTGVQSILYKSQAEALTSVVSGVTVFVIAGTGDLVKLAEAGRVRVLAVGSTSRVPVMPKVPTMAEAFAPFVYTNLNGVYAPRATPVAIQQFLNEAWSDAVWNASTITFLHQRGILPAGGDLKRARALHDSYYRSRESLYKKYKSAIDGQ